MENNMKNYEVCKSALGKGFVKFSYIKRDGSLRIAIGTRCPDILDSLEVQFYDTPREVSDEICPYYDLVRGAWRSFRIKNFQEILFNNLSDERAYTEAISIALFERESLGNCLENGIKMFGDSTITKIMDFVIWNDFTKFDSNTEYEEQLRCEVFPNAPSEKPSTTQMIVDDTKEALIQRLMELRREEDEILTKILQWKEVHDE